VVSRELIEPRDRACAAQRFGHQDHGLPNSDAMAVAAREKFAAWCMDTLHVVLRRTSAELSSRAEECPTLPLTMRQHADEPDKRSHLRSPRDNWSKQHCAALGEIAELRFQIASPFGSAANSRTRTTRLLPTITN